MRPNKYNFFLLSTVVLIIVVISIMIYVNLNSSKNIELEEYLAISYPPSHPIENLEPITDITLHGKVIPVSYSLTNNAFINELTGFGFNSKDNKNNIRFILVNASSYKTAKEVYERVNTARSLTGKIISTKTTIVNNREISMAIKLEALGAGKYMLIGGFKEGSKGYYFEIGLEDRRAKIQLTSEDINNIFNFNYNLNPPLFLDLINNILDQNLPDSSFKTLNYPYTADELDKFRVDNEGLFPSTF